MKKTRFTESQIMGVLRQAEGGPAVPELCRRLRISSATFYKWRARYGDMDAAMMGQMKALEDENRRLKRMFADLSMQADLLKESPWKIYGSLCGCKVVVHGRPACVNVADLWSVSRFWRQGLDEIRASGSRLVVRDRVPLFFARGLPEVDQPFGHHFPLQSVLRSSGQFRAAPFDCR